MQVRLDQLSGHLRKGLASIYLIAGDEPLSVMEAQDAVRVSARADGYTDRERFEVARGFDWAQFLAAANSLSLFAERRILEVHMPTGKPGDAGGKALRAFAAQPAPDTVLLITCGKLEASTRKTKWFLELTKAGVYVPVYPIEPKQLPAWIRRRMGVLGMKPTNDAAALLAERVEGNLLACAQEIDKLYLLHGKSDISLDNILDGVADSARYDVFGLVDAVLLGESTRSMRILDGLRAEGVEPLVVLWALTREVRSLGLMAGQMAAGQSLPAVMTTAKVWDRRKEPVGTALQRHKGPAWQHFLGTCGHIDRVCKGQRTGSSWEELLQLCMEISGVMRPLSGHVASF